MSLAHNVCVYFFVLFCFSPPGSFSSKKKNKRETKHSVLITGELVKSQKQKGTMSVFTEWVVGK